MIRPPHRSAVALVLHCDDAVEGEAAAAEGVAAAWTFGPVVRCSATPPALAAGIDEVLGRLPDDEGDSAVVVWSAGAGGPPPDPAALLDEGRLDLVHGGRPSDKPDASVLLGAAWPTWMLDLDPTPADATSWRVDLDRCIVSTIALRRCGGLDPAFDTRAAAGLEFGHRLIRSGAFVRRAATLVPEHATTAARPTARDEVRFARSCVGEKWLMYAIATTPGRRLERARAARSDRSSPLVARGLRERTSGDSSEVGDRPRGAVTVLIPTIDRYPYLEVVLDQLRCQTVAPHQVVVIDQTPTDRRRDLRQDFTDLPLVWAVRENPGQSSARNDGLRRATGDFVLFIDDDDEVEPDLIERHLRSLATSGADASCGIAHEPGSGAQPADFTYVRQADTFPTNNTMLRVSALVGVGGFDLTYDRGTRADHDLGTRLHLAGRHLVLDPTIEVLHHRAPMGGLRTHGARVTTAGAARAAITTRNALNPTEAYLWRRFHGESRAKAALRIRLLSGLVSSGGLTTAIGRLLVQLALAPQTSRRLWASYRAADELLDAGPQVEDVL